MIRYKLGETLPQVEGLAHGSVVTVGNFDGLHLGHRMILEKTVAMAQSQGKAAVAVVFDPHPAVVLRPATVLPLLSTVAERYQTMTCWGVASVVCLEFTRELSLLTAREFCQKILKQWLKMELLCVGQGFRLGHKRQGDETELRGIGSEIGFQTHFLPPYVVAGAVVSSSRIRDVLLQGAVEEAATLLGHPYVIRGQVVQGEQRGRSLGFPTANLQIEANRLLPARGVYATTVTCQGQSFNAVTNVGHRPTFDKPEQLHVESYLLDFQGDLYGEQCALAFAARLRDEQTFQDPQALQQAISTDIASARAFFAQVGSTRGL